MTKTIDDLRGVASALFIGFLWLCVPLAAVTALVGGQAWLGPTLACAVGAVIASLARPLGISATGREYLISILMVVQVSILVMAAAGPWQIDYHFFYFAVLAMLTAYCRWPVLIVGAGVTAVHHLTLSFLIPEWVFPGGSGGLLRVLFHAVVVVLETGILVWLAWRLEHLFQDLATQTAASQQARQEAEIARQAQQVQTAESAKLHAGERQNLASRFVGQVGDLQQKLTAALTALAQDAKQMIDTAEDARNAAQTASSYAATAETETDRVAGVISDLLASISAVSGAIATTASDARSTSSDVSSVEHDVTRLSETVGRIGQVVELIANIAAQTNLLALNATIEAARAGDAGKGFAVVASEVKALAAQTARATDDITREVAEIQQATQAVSGAVRRIGGAVSGVDSAASDISGAVAEQTETVRDLSRSIQSVADQARRLGDMVDDFVAIATKIGQAGDNSTRSATNATNASQDLERQLGQFVAHLRTAEG